MACHTVLPGGSIPRLAEGKPFSSAAQGAPGHRHTSPIFPPQTRQGSRPIHLPRPARCGAGLEKPGRHVNHSHVALSLVRFRSRSVGDWSILRLRSASCERTLPENMDLSPSAARTPVFLRSRSDPTMVAVWFQPMENAPPPPPSGRFPTEPPLEPHHPAVRRCQTRSNRYRCEMPGDASDLIDTPSA